VQCFLLQAEFHIPRVLYGIHIGDGNLSYLTFLLTSFLYLQWYPCGSFKGDARSKALCQNYADDGLFSGMAKKQLDTGMAGSLFREIGNLAGTVIRAYPQLKKSKDNLEYGYKVAFEGLPENQEITPVKPTEQSGILDSIKGMFS
jgi:hypothetical protein